MATVVDTTGERKRLDFSGFESRTNGCLTYAIQERFFRFFLAKCLYDLNGLETLLHNRYDLALLLANFVSGFLHRFLNLETNSSRKGVTATAISVKSQFSQNISPSMHRMVSMSTRMVSVEEEAKPSMV